MTSKNVLFFPHERATLAAVHDLNVRSKSRRRLQALLTEASTVVQRHTATLDGPERARIGPFEELVELAERHAAQTKGSIVADLVLLTTVQIGQLLVYVALTLTGLFTVLTIHLVWPKTSPLSCQRGYIRWHSALDYWQQALPLLPRR